MPTVLLQAILDLLKGFVETWGNFAQYILDVLADIFEKLGLLEEIGDDVEAIKDNTQDIQADVLSFWNSKVNTILIYWLVG